MSTQPLPHRSIENKVLAALSSSESQRFLSIAERVSLTQSEVIYEPETQIQYVYFPETAVFSMLAAMQDSDTVEVGPVGDEGLVGLSVFFGASTSPTQVIVHVASDAMKIKANVLREELGSGRSVLPRLLLRYTQMLLAMTGQSAACYKLHSLEQQLARWLLIMHDYVKGDDLLLTHDLIALTLGVRRAGITNALLGLREAGLIAYGRGRIQILNRQSLEVRACECYQLIKEEFDRLYADLSPASPS